MSSIDQVETLTQMNEAKEAFEKALEPFVNTQLDKLAAEHGLSIGSAATVIGCSFIFEGAAALLCSLGYRGRESGELLEFGAGVLKFARDRAKTEIRKERERA